jgi:hypothetical protein
MKSPPTSIFQKYAENRAQINGRRSRFVVCCSKASVQSALRRKAPISTGLCDANVK